MDITTQHVTPQRRGIESFSGKLEFVSCNTFNINGIPREFVPRQIEGFLGLEVLVWVEDRRLGTDELIIAILYLPQTRQTKAFELTYSMWQLMQRDRVGTVRLMLTRLGIDA